jgi:hypothetical protein
MRTRGANWSVLAAALCVLLLSGCGGTLSGPKRGTARVALELETLAAAEQLTVTLSASDASELHQLACRVAYNPDALRFTGAERGTLVDSRAVFFTTAKGAGYVPVAFTYHTGETIPASSGCIATLRFDVLDASADTGVALVQDAEFLVARDALKRSIDVRVSGAAR